MKKIILCEGKFDGIFIKSILNKLNFSDGEIKIFNIEDIPMEKREKREHIELEHFIDTKNNNKILVKLENGKNFAIRIYSHIMPHCAKEINNCCLMIDLETGSAKDKIKEIEERLKYLRRANPISIITEEKRKHKHLHHFDGIIKREKSQEIIGNFKIVFFKKSLEISCKINKESDTEKEKKEKIEKFILENEIHNFLSEVINPISPHQA